MFSSRLKSLRLKKGLSQQDMAEFIGISRQGYGKYEDGKSEPDHQTLIKLADFFDVTVDYLLGHDKKTDKTDEEIRKNIIIEKIKKEFAGADLMFKDLANMNAEQLEEVYDFIKFKLSKE